MVSHILGEPMELPRQEPGYANLGGANHVVYSVDQFQGHADFQG